MKVSELTGALLDYWVARAEGIACIGEEDEYALKEWGEHGVVWYAESGERGGIEPLSNRGSPSTDWALGGPIIDREPFGIFERRDGMWHAGFYQEQPGFKDVCIAYQAGPTMLVAAMRAYVASKFGEEVPEA